MPIFFGKEISADSDLSGLITDPSLISLESPAEHEQNNDNSLLSIYLYRITEDAHRKNQFPVQGNGGRQRKPPMALDLNYLITPLLKEPRDQQIVLGKIIQVLYDRPTLEGPDLSGSLGASGEQIRVIFNPVSLEEISRVWQALETSYRLSVCYTIRVTMLDSTREVEAARVLNQITGFEGRDPHTVSMS